MFGQDRARFSQHGQKTYDQSGWTAAPGQGKRAAKEAREAAKAAEAEAAPTPAELAAQRAGREYTDAYDALYRPKSLVEQYQEQLRKGGGAVPGKGGAGAGGGAAAGTTPGQAGYRPFDRERDLAITRRPDGKDAVQTILESGQGLGSRFSGGTVKRSM
jgi:hypothetical protein